MEWVEKEKQDCLYRTYKKETGRSLAQYMLEKRMEKARKLLQGDMFVKNVALQMGYSNFERRDTSLIFRRGLFLCAREPNCCKTIWNVIVVIIQNRLYNPKQDKSISHWGGNILD